FTIPVLAPVLPGPERQVHPFIPAVPEQLPEPSPMPPGDASLRPPAPLATPSATKPLPEPLPLLPGDTTSLPASKPICTQAAHGETKCLPAMSIRELRGQ